MTTEEIHDAIQQCPANEQHMTHMLGIMEEMNGTSIELERAIVALTDLVAELRKDVDNNRATIRAITDNIV